MDETLKTAAHRKPGHPVDPLFPARWSRRAMSGAHLSRETLMTLFEAARWAPSSFNNQPWRFVYAARGTEAWPRFLDLVTPRNKSWCQGAGALIIIVSKHTFDADGRLSKTHSFDTGSAWMSLAVQANMLGLTARGMEGFDYGRAIDEVGLPDGYSVEAMCAVGYPAPADVLPEDLRAKEIPTGRRPLAETVFEGRFPDSA
ncbi:MAG: nitroreductase family protein [Fibrobacterota bacterium]|nr:nitroreductase family protein [Fibrobacterota bacterium]